MALKVSIDTCILLDLLLNQNPESIEKLRRHHHDHDDLVICGMVYGELYPILKQNIPDMDQFFSEMGINIELCIKEDYAYAGEKWEKYIRRRKLICPACGKSIKLKCTHCDANIGFRQHILSDFIIGAFSELHCDGLLTRDYGYYKTYFPTLNSL